MEARSVFGTSTHHKHSRMLKIKDKFRKNDTLYFFFLGGGLFQNALKKEFVVRCLVQN